MPIRKRGPSWQVDVRLPDGRRYRKTVNTEDEAKALEASLRTNPQQRRAMKAALRRSSGAMNAAPTPYPQPSESALETQRQENSTQDTLPTSVVPWPRSR